MKTRVTNAHFDEDRTAEGESKCPECADEDIALLAGEFRLQGMNDGNVAIDGHGDQRVDRADDEHGLSERCQLAHE